MGLWLLLTGGLTIGAVCGALAGPASVEGEPGSEVQAEPLRQITPGQRLGADAHGQWAEVEGEVTFASEQGGDLVLELSSSTGRMGAKVSAKSGASPLLLLHSRLRVSGRIQIATTLDGDQVAGGLLVPGAEHLQVLEWATTLWKAWPAVTIGSLEQTDAIESKPLVRLRGTVEAILPGRKVVVSDGTGRVVVETVQSGPRAEGILVELLARGVRDGTNVVLRCGGYRELAPREDERLDLPQLTRVEQIKSLSPGEAQRGYPVRIRGIVTSVLRNGFFIQDATWAVYVVCPATEGRERPGASEYWEVEGATCEGFAPSITPERLRWLAAGAMPEPLHPSWDQLINGSLDAQYVEVQGIVTWVQGSEMSLLTRSGKINIRLVETPPRPLKDYEGALVRLRGCVIPGRETSTMRVQLGRIELSNYLINIDEAAPADPFATTPLRRVPELLLFNWRASAIERIRTSGQVVHGRNGEYYLMDGTNGLRFFPKPAVTLPVGEQVEVVGFPGLGGPSPVFREALVRRKGITPMPSARTIGPETLMSRHNDATLVRVQGRLVNISQHRAEEVLELRTESHGFLARLEASPHARRDLLRGSLLELIGVYSGQGISPASGREVDGFELLLNSPADIRVLEKPSWWTLPRVLWGFGATSLVAMISLGWVFTLRGEVRRKTRILQQKVEREAVLEERTRIAREFHDTIEQEVAAVTLQLQAARARIDKSPEFVRHALQLAESMLRHAQSEARHSVWNLRAQALEDGSLREALGAVANYARNGAEVQTEVRVEGVERVLPGRFENHLLRICQEATSNAIKHGRARHVSISLSYGQDRVRLSIKDDGQGFVVGAAPSGAAGHFGLLGMQERAEKIAGALTITSVPGQGTEIILDAPLPGPGGTAPKAAVIS